MTESKGRTLGELLETFAQRRATNLEELAALELDEQQLERTGLHPTLGRVTLAQLLATWVVHDLAHSAQIARTMASRYRAAVGPWNRPDYLPVLQPG